MEFQAVVTVVTVIIAHGLGLVIGAGIIAKKNIDRIEKISQAMSKIGAAQIWTRALKVAQEL